MNEFSAASFSFVRCKEYLGVKPKVSRRRLTDSQRDEMLIRMEDQLDSLHIRLSNRITQRRHEVCDTAGDITKIVRMEFPDFEGKVDATQFVDWLAVIEEYFNWYDMMDDRRVRFAKMKLVGLAKVWWTAINYYDKLCDHLFNLRQNNMPVVEYMQKFDELKTRSQIVEDHRQTLARFKAGLRSEIKRELLHQPLYSLEHTFQVALDMEEYVGHSFHRKPEAMTMESAQKKLHDTSQSMKPGSSHPFNPPTGFKSSSSQVVDPKAPKMEEEDWRQTSIFQMLVQCGNQAHKLIVDSDSSHIILGRPWLYDRDVHHCGKENTYSFMFKNQKVGLKPMTVAEMGKYRIQKSTKVVEGMKRKQGYICCNNEENGMKDAGNISSIPKKAAELLNNFSDIGPVDLPSELPPLHNIQHSIDFMSGSQLPNFPAYRMNPIESAELKTLAPIPWLDDMLDMMAGSYIFSKIDLRVGIIKYGLEVDPNKVKAILEWPVPSTLQELRSFHVLSTFYGRFIRSFSTIMAPITDCMKKNQFVWTKATTKAFEEIKKRLTKALVLQLPIFQKYLKKASYCIFSEKLNEAKQKYSIYDKEFYVMVQTLRYWCHYLLPKEFVLYFDHEALKYVNSQKKHNHRHGKWVSLLQEYTFVIRHKSGVENKAADALSQVWDYNSYKDFNIIYDALAAGIAGAYPDFSLHDGYLFKGPTFAYLTHHFESK
ncbi:hypothetical protein AAG906_018818 [Vitis piasezkii]